MGECRLTAEQHDDCAEGRRNLGLDVLARGQPSITTTADGTDDLTLQVFTA